MLTRTMGCRGNRTAKCLVVNISHVDKALANLLQRHSHKGHGLTGTKLCLVCL